MHTFQHRGQRFIIKYSQFRFDMQASAARQDSSQVQAVESKQVWNRCDGPEVTARQQIKILKCHTIRTSVMITKLLLSLIVKS